MREIHTTGLISFYFCLQPLFCLFVVSLLLSSVSGQKGGAKGAMRGRGKGGKGRGGGGSRSGGYQDAGDFTVGEFGGGYGGAGRPCIGLCYLR